jgi:hypothetical protein
LTRNDRQPLRFGALAAALLVLAALPASAAADDLRIGYSPLQPVVGQPMHFTARAYDPYPDPQQIDVFIRAHADGTCGDTMTQEAAAGSTHVFSEGLTPNMASANPTTFTATFTPAVIGDYTVCGYDQFAGHSGASAEYTAEFTVTQPSGPGPGAHGTSCIVPRLLGKRVAAAKRALRDAHCSVGAVSTKKSKLSARGRVVSQSAPAGAKLAAGTKVRLVVGR